MKILIVTGGMTLPEVTDEELEQIYVASGEGEIVVAGSPDEAKAHWPDAEVALGTLDRETFLTAKNLRWLHCVSAGVDMLLFPEMVESEVALTGEKGLVGEHLADHAFGLLLSLTRQLKRPILEAPKIWHLRAPLRKVMVELTGLTMGIVGLGGTGRAVAKRARAFGMECIAVDVEDVPPCPDVGEVWGMERFHDFLAASDVVTICCPLTKQTRGMFDDEAFASMRPTAFLVNVTRGPIVDPEAITKALNVGQIAGAGLDVTPIEPLPEDHPLWEMPNVVITPHTAGASQFRARRNVARFIRNLGHYRAGRPLEGQIDKQKGY
ncbi:MAG TPA: D-2-hydroxyacid dehydrogenase [Dehalococcoidia bacterium]|nr:D-2-hydroxyacid dehydrogenase [Dehalococcoidia bacterium]